MNLQIDISNECKNSCPICISKMHKPFPFNEASKHVWLNGLKRGRELCDTATISGRGEPLLFTENTQTGRLWALFKSFQQVDNIFKQVDVQTSGTEFSANSLNMMSDCNVSTVAISVANMFSSEQDLAFKGRRHLDYRISTLCDRVKSWRFTLRLTVLLNTMHSVPYPEELIDYAGLLGADQLTFKELKIPENSQALLKSSWIKRNKMKPYLVNELRAYIEKEGVPIPNTNPSLYKLFGMTVALDEDCMNETRYLVLRPNGKLYYSWNSVVPIE